MEVYFVVLRLPGSTELKFIDGNSPQHFWNIVSRTIDKGEARIVSVRTDTGVSEEVRSHIGCHDFETYFLFYQMMEQEEIKNPSRIFEKAKDLLKIGNYEFVIDANDNFQLVTLDYLDNQAPMPNSGSNSPALSA